LLFSIVKTGNGGLFDAFPPSGVTERVFVSVKSFPHVGYGPFSVFIVPFLSFLVTERTVAAVPTIDLTDRLLNQERNKVLETTFVSSASQPFSDLRTSSLFLFSRTFAGR